MADRSVDVLIVGAGAAGAACVRELRERGFDGSVLLVGREPDPPYERPPATKSYLVGASSREDALILPEDWYGRHGVELLTRTSVMKLDPQAREARLSTKETVGFDRALLATGANVRRLPVEGGQLEGIHYIRALRNADALREDVAGAQQVVMIGGAYVGCETAASLTALGKRCTVVMMEQVALEAHFGAAAGAAIQRVLEDHGVAFAAGETVERLEGGGDRVERVVCASGRVLEADAVVVGVGAQPDVMLARSAGLELGELGGVACSATLQTSAAGVYAAGDVCQYESPVHGRPIRVEHHEHAVAQGRTAARNLMGEGVAHEELPYFWSDLADWLTVEYVGPAPEGWEQEVVRGSLDDGPPWTVWYLRAGAVVAALTAGRSGDLDEARRLIASAEPVAAERLAAA